MRNLKAIAMIVAGSILVALPEPVTTAIGIALIGKGLQMLRSQQEASEVAEAKQAEAA